MSKSKGDTITAAELLKLLPPEIVWYFILRFSPDKLLFFDEGQTLMKLFDDFAELMAKPDKSVSEQQLATKCVKGMLLTVRSTSPFVQSSTSCCSLTDLSGLAMSSAKSSNSFMSV